MDPITHIASGALAGRLLHSRFGTRLAYALCILAAWLPDIDNFVGLSPEDYLLHHRGITHSLVGISAQALILTALFWLLHKAFKPMKTFIVSLSLLALHLWLDVVTTYGTQLMAPFSKVRYDWGAVFIIDPFLTLTALGLFVWSLRSREHGRRIATLGLAFMLLYPVATHSVRGLVEDSMPQVLAENGIQAESITVSTDLLSPIFWKIIVEDGDRLRIGSVSAIPALHSSIEFAEFTKADPTLLSRLGQEASFFATWDWFAKWPTMKITLRPDGGRDVEFLDARFYSHGPIARRYMDISQVPFTLTAVLGTDETLTRFRYNHHGQVIAYAVTN
ncbi:metal-dependent hydrolase [Desulfovibrio ferrophilus]|uniref:Putative membrane-bound metal-dependent hydrolase n=1 Tax=Desulfovibrio ferrophilus TaxID=241368 RepID=A0A2Z6AYK5_9BACT|nr:metal-dependent hydrolase [Desulfovibrio ferrophilus]BBD08280.1 putative membrane-bound metal-dependent hydrolase [Desulfovibrio ferrophilus]